MIQSVKFSKNVCFKPRKPARRFNLPIYDSLYIWHSCVIVYIFWFLSCQAWGRYIIPFKMQRIVRCRSHTRGPYALTICLTIAVGLIIDKLIKMLHHTKRT